MNRLTQAMYGALLALQFLSRIPVPINCPWEPATQRWAVRCYPLIGLLLGALLASVGSLLAPWLPLPLVALLLLSLWVALSGGLHLDGLMDLADALGSNTPRERRFAIMKDPHAGSFAVIALVFLLAWKALLLGLLLQAGVSLVPLILVLALGRLGAVGLLAHLPAARREGLAFTWQQSLSRRDLWLAAVPVALLCLVWPLGWGLLACLVPFLVIYGAAMRRSFGGINGDMLGAAIEGGEVCSLLMWWSFTWFVMA